MPAVPVEHRRPSGVFHTPNTIHARGRLTFLIFFSFLAVSSSESLDELFPLLLLLDEEPEEELDELSESEDESLLQQTQKIVPQKNSATDVVLLTTTTTAAGVGFRGSINGNGAHKT